MLQDHADQFHVESSGEERFKSYLGIRPEHDGELHGVLVGQPEQTKTFFHRHIQEVHRAGRDLMVGLTALVA